GLGGRLGRRRPRRRPRTARRLGHRRDGGRPVNGSVLKVGTRRSVLATTQSGWVGQQLADAIGVSYELVTIRTEGDDTSRPLTQLGGTGVFVSAVREALLAGEVDLA